MSNQTFPSAARTASFNGPDNLKVPGMRGLSVVIDMTVVPGADTVTFTIQGKDATSGKYYTLLASTAIVAVSTVRLVVAPGLPAAANASANDELPDVYRIIATHSAGTSFTYSIGATELP